MPQVTIYSTPTCPFCKIAKTYFDERKIEYQEKNVAANPKAREEMLEKSGQGGVPVIEIDGQIVVGFDQPKLAELLK